MRTIWMRRLAVATAVCGLCSIAPGQMHGGAAGTGQNSAPTNRPTNEAPTAPETENATGPEADKTFLKKAMEANVGEVQMAQLALQKSTDPQVRNFAVKMEDDHGKMMDDLKQAAQQLNIPVPDAPSKGTTKSMDKMKDLSGDAFDQAYVKEMIKAHKEDEKAFKEEVRTTTSPQLKQMINEDAQTIESHLEEIQQIGHAKGKG